MCVHAASSAVNLPNRRVLLLAVLLFGALVLDTQPAWSDPNHDRDRGVYVGIGSGVGYLNPDDSDTNIQVEERKDIAAQIFLGLDLTTYLGAELQYTHLGEAELSNNGRLDYREASVSGLLYGLNTQENLKKRKGLRGFGRLGIGRLFTDATNVVHEQSNDLHLLLGAGAEYGFANGVAFRGEYLSYDHDAKYIQLSVLYRFSRHPRKRTPVEEPPLPAPLNPTATSGDSDNDGVIDADDLCPGTVFQANVDNVGCPVFEGVLDGVNFRTASAELTPGAELILTRAAQELVKFPNTLIIIMAHTDSVGAAAYNLDLSERRASSVALFMASRGIDPARLKPEAFGETRPIADNSTQVGRFKNRRVEFDTTQLR